MSRQKCMSFSKFSILEAESVIHLRLRRQRDKGRTKISNEQNFKNKAF